MNREFKQAYGQLNPQQRLAVETIDGPVLVIAGPGTGKTQLIGTRAGYILKQAEVEPANILLLTFTDAAVAEMRRRLEKLIPAQAHKVNIYTYHGFANDLIRNNLDYFAGMENDPIDELSASQLLTRILDELPYSHPLKSGSFYQPQILGFISDTKRSMLRPADIRALAKANLGFIKAANRHCRKHLGRLGRLSKSSVPVFEALRRELSKLPEPAAKLPPGLNSLREMMWDSLVEALADSAAAGKVTPLVSWKNRWLEKDRSGNFVAAGRRQNERLLAAAEVYELYQQELSNQRVYDYDDMISQALAVLKSNPDFRLSLAEHYQYVMLDEFQDTNPAQFELVRQLTDVPVYENRPNILAVGDDDQAIYAFQGAEQANMTAFAKAYRDVKIISLENNYRSHQSLIELAGNIAGQIETRLQHGFEGVEKTLTAAGPARRTRPKIEAREFQTDVAELNWLSKKIKLAIKAGTPASEIAVIAPRHKYLEKLVPYLARQGLPVAYEKREDVLADPKVRMVIQAARLVQALADGDEKTADSLWPEVLSYEFWKVAVEEIWQLSWDASQSKRYQPWTPLVLHNQPTRKIARFMLELAAASRQASLEEMLDALIGIGEIDKKLKLPMRSPFFGYYFSGQAVRTDAAQFTGLLSNLNLLRARLRNRQRREVQTTKLNDLLEYADGLQAAGLNLLNTSPYHQSQDAVHLLTAYAAKGREFKTVFIMSAQSEVWGEASRLRQGAISLPPNLRHISYAGMSTDERLRLLYVAASRAKSHLYLSSHQQTLDGRRLRRLEYLRVQPHEHGHTIVGVLPAKFQKLIIDEQLTVPAAAVEDYWAERHLPGYKPRLKSLLAQRQAEYKLSATHLNKFIDLEAAGPQDFFIYYFLGFPQAPTETTAFGTAVHDSLAWAGQQLAKTGRLPGGQALSRHFEAALSGGWLRDAERQRLLERGNKALPVWLRQARRRLSGREQFEKNFRSENVQLGEARLTGKVDRLLIDPKRKRITVVDVKTGKAYANWQSTTKLHKFKQQLMFYKLLVEGSNSYRNHIVDQGVIEFAEPEDGQLVSLAYQFDEAELERFKLLVKAVWARIQALDLPATAGYPKSLRGIKQFEADLIKNAG